MHCWVDSLLRSVDMTSDLTRELSECHLSDGQWIEHYIHRTMTDNFLVILEPVC